MQPKTFYVYIMANKTNTTLYVGVTNDLKKRVWQHKEKSVDGFTKRYNLTKLVCYEIFSDAPHAIAREKQFKGGSRKKKEDAIKGMNAEWRDLYDDL